MAFTSGPFTAPFQSEFTSVVVSTINWRCLEEHFPSQMGKSFQTRHKTRAIGDNFTVRLTCISFHRNPLQLYVVEAVDVAD